MVAPFYFASNFKCNNSVSDRTDRYFNNRIYLPRKPGDVLSSDLSLTERVIIMSTYEELQIILTTALLIVAILTYTHKK